VQTLLFPYLKFLLQKYNANLQIEKLRLTLYEKDDTQSIAYNKTDTVIFVQTHFE
jgi:hypothetical protein